VLVVVHLKPIFKKNLILSSQRITRIWHLKSATFFASTAHVRPTKRGEVLFLNVMKESKSLFGRLILKVGRTPDKAGQHRCRVDETKTWRTNHVWSTSFVENASRPNPLRNLRNQRQKIRVNPCLIFLRASVPLWLKFDLSAVALAKADQSKTTNYAKQSQFPKDQK